MDDLKIPVAIIGSGNIGSDLCERLLASRDFSVEALIGRRPDSPGLIRFKHRVPYVLPTGLDGLLSIHEKVEGFFDASSALEHIKNWEALRPLGKWVVDLTPSKIGKPMVPTLIGELKNFQINPTKEFNFSMVTCGGQSSAPILYAIGRNSSQISEIEVSSSIASKSAGAATRLNVDQYIESTENLINLITKCDKVKAILVLNPAEPPVMMRTTVCAKVLSCDLDRMNEDLIEISNKVRESVPGFEIIIKPHFSSNNTISTTVKVAGAGYFLPTYAGNLDIINAAAVETARAFISSKNQQALSEDD